MSLLTEISFDDLENLSQAIGEAIFEAILKGKDEPNKVAQLTYRIPKHVNQVSLNTKGYILSAGGMFIHQRPYVIYNANKCVELGDLLLISTIIDSHGTHRKAMLLQAKMFNQLPASTGNQDQHDLYNEWPQFAYKSSELNHAVRKINGLDIHSSAKYLLIAKTPRCIPYCGHLFGSHFLIHEPTCCALTAHPTAELSHHNCFAEELLQFVLGDKGKSFQYGTDLAIDDIGWSRVIDDLLRKVAAKTTKKMRAPRDNPTGKRGYDCLLFGHQLSFLHSYGSDSWNSNDNEPPEEIPPRPENNDEDGGGISVIEFVLRREESQETRS